MIALLSAYGRTRRVRIAAVIYGLIAVILSRIPLFNYLGYEFSAVLTVPASVITGILTILALRDHRDSLRTGRQVWAFIGSVSLANAVLLFVPLSVIMLNALVVRNCAMVLGGVYFVLLPVLTVLFSTALALVIGELSRHAIPVFLLCVTAILGHIILITYFQPQLFAYNFILGFFPGITYDETLTDLSHVAAYRFFTLAAAVMFTALFSLLVKFPQTDGSARFTRHRAVRILRHAVVPTGLIGLCLAVLIAAHLFRSTLGFEHSADDIRSALGRRSSSEHFVFHFRAEDVPSGAIVRLKAEAEFHYRKVAEFLRVQNNTLGPISVYLYPDGEWKQRYIGTATTNIAKPWRREMHITTGTFATTFRHELVHVLAAEFGAPVIHASIRMGWNEGLAVAAEWDVGMFSPHEYAAGLLHAGRLGDVTALFSLSGFAVRSGMFAYTVSGSFVRYLIERYGIERVKGAFPLGNVMGAFGRPLDELVTDWKSFLRTVDASLLPAETLEALFSQPSIFYKVCAREVAAQNRRAVIALRAGNNGEAEERFRRSFTDAASLFALRGLLHTMNARQAPQEVFQQLQHLDPASPLRTHPAIQLLEGDACMLAGATEAAAQKYAGIGAMMYSEAFLEASRVRLQCVKDSLTAEEFHTIVYAAGPDSLKMLKLRTLRGDGAGTVSVFYHRQFLSASQTDLPEAQLSRIPEDLRYFAWKRLAERRYDTGAYEQAKAAFWQAKNLAPTDALMQRLDDRIEACEIVPLELE